MNLVEHLIRADKLQQKHIVVVGDAMRDVYIHGETFHCQEGCRKFLETERFEAPGGADNAARALSTWNCHITKFTVLTGVKTRYLVGGACVFRVDEEWPVAPLSAVLPPCDAVLISDYDKGSLDERALRQWIRAAHERKAVVVVDAKQPPMFYTGAIVKGNAEYASRYTCDVATNGDGWPRVRGDLTGIDWMPVPCVNHVGAGDCFAAHLTLALVHGFTLEEAAIIAHSAGRVYVQHRHNQPPTPGEIASDLGSPRLAKLATGIEK